MEKKRKLPKGLYWRNGSPHIYFSWRDSRRSQHQECTGTSDPAQALIFKLQFLERQKENPQAEIEVEVKTEDLSKFPLREVSNKYFVWKQANGSAGTIARERRLFKRVLKFFGPNQQVKAIHLELIRKYQTTRRAEVTVVPVGVARLLPMALISPCSIQTSPLGITRVPSKIRTLRTTKSPDLGAWANADPPSMKTINAARICCRRGEGPAFIRARCSLKIASSNRTPAGLVPADRSAAAASPKPLPTVLVEGPADRIEDDRDNLQPGDAVLLIVEDDPHCARVLCDLSRDKGFKVLVAMRGAEALSLAREFRPTAVSLDVFLPDMLGWTVLNHLKQYPATRHIPVQMLTLDEDWHHGLSRGAFSFVTKPSTPEGLETALGRIKEYTKPRRKRLLVVEDNPAEQMTIRELLGYDDIDVTVAATGSEALNYVNEEPFDCMVLDLRLPDMSGFEVLKKLGDEPAASELPVVVFTGKELSAEEDARLHTLARSVVVKDVESPERLLDETALFLHALWLTCRKISRKC